MRVRRPNVAAVAGVAAALIVCAVPASAAPPPSVSTPLPVTWQQHGDGGGQFTDATAAGPVQAYAIAANTDNDDSFTELYRWRAGRWAPFAGPATYVGAVAAGGPNDLWVTGAQDVSRWDGTAWQHHALPAQNPDDNQVNDVAVAGGHVFVAGNDGAAGVVYSGDGTAFTRTELAGSLGAWTIEARSATDVWVLGFAGSGWGSWHFDGTSWQALPPFDQNLTPGALTPDGPGTAWLAATVYDTNTSSAHPVLLRAAGGAWTETAVPIPTGASGQQITALGVDGRHRLWLAFRSDLPDRSLYLRRDGTSWTTIYGPTRTDAIDVETNKLVTLPVSGALLSVGRVQVFPDPARPMSELLLGIGR